MNNTSEPPSPSQRNEELIKQLLMQSSSYTINIGQDVITTTSDKIKLCIQKHQSHLNTKSGWTTPLALCISFVLSIITTHEYKTVLGIKSERWPNIIFLALLISGGWLIYALIKSIVIHFKYNIDKIIKELKSPSL